MPIENPGRTSAARIALRINSPAAVSIISDKDSCPITSRLPRVNSRRAPPATSSPVFSFRSNHTSGFESFHAGNSANTTVLSPQNASVAPATRISGLAWYTRSSGASLCSEAISSVVLQDASSKPPAPPSSASSIPSVISCRTIRPRPPPIASRIAISFRRAAPRAIIMFDRFSDAISSTTAESDSSRIAGTRIDESSVGLVETLRRESGLTSSAWSLFKAGYACSICDDNTASGAVAASWLMPSRYRPTRISDALSRAVSGLPCVSKSFIARL